MSDPKIPVLDTPQALREALDLARVEGYLEIAAKSELGASPGSDPSALRALILALRGVLTEWRRVSSGSSRQLYNPVYREWSDCSYQKLDSVAEHALALGEAALVPPAEASAGGSPPEELEQLRLERARYGKRAVHHVRAPLGRRWGLPTRRKG
jgi:hypothetical protein